MKHKEASTSAIRTFRDDEDEALLRLALLKERADYRKYFTPELRKAVESAWSKNDEDATLTFYNFHHELRSRFGIVYSTGEGYMLDLLDPRVDVKAIPARVRRVILPDLFYTPGVREVVPSLSSRVGRGEAPRRTTSTDCAPYERLWKIDLRKKPAQLLQEFKAALEAVDVQRGKNPAAYASWKQDRTRKRKEAWIHLEVWRSWWRIDKPSFADIGRELGITEDAAKKSFRRAFELIYGIPFTREAWEEKRAEFAVLYPEHFEEKRSTRESIFDNFEEVSDAHSFNEWRTREEENE